MEKHLSCLYEPAKHGTPQFPFTTYELINLPAVNEVYMHWHKEIEICYFIDGCTYFMKDLKTYRVTPGDMLIIPPNSLHAMNNTESEYVTFKSIVFDLNMLSHTFIDICQISYIAPLLNNIYSFPDIIHSNTPGQKELSDCFSKIAACFQKKEPAYELEIHSLLNYFFALLYKNNLIQTSSKETKLMRKTTQKIREILNYLDENYMEEFSISDLANRFNFSKYHFIHFFKQNTGTTCIDYVNHLRLENSCKLLQNTDDSILEISYRCGFNSVSYFNKLFKRKYQMTPNQYRTSN